MKKDKYQKLIAVILVFLVGFYMISHARCRLVIKDGVVVKIKNGFSESIRQVKYIEIPEGVEQIGTMAFMDCYNLKEISIPKSIKQINAMAFMGPAERKRAMMEYEQELYFADKMFREYNRRV